MTILYAALALRAIAGSGAFIAIWTLTLAQPSNADVVEGRLRAYETGLADVIDVLVVFGEAGLTFESEMEKVGQKYDHPVAEEFVRVLHEVRLGKPRLEALNDMAQRCGVEELNSFVQTVIQSEQLGSGLVKVLGIQADEIRQKRLMTAQERGARASLKMLIPMVGCIFPTLWVILLGPALILLLHSGVVH